MDAPSKSTTLSSAGGSGASGRAGRANARGGDDGGEREQADHWVSALATPTSAAVYQRMLYRNAARTFMPAVDV